jgi:DNA-directed RNA polymerase specialized sigma24 family protein
VYVRKPRELARRRHDREDERREAADFVAWALPRIANERRRTVLERTLDGVPAAAIAADLGVSMDNLYQLRRRALSDLAKLKELYDA